MTDEIEGEAYAASPGGRLRIQRSEQPDGVVVLSLAGELDIESGQTLANVLRNAENAGAARIELDLAGLEFIDSTGISVLMQARVQARHGNREFVLRRLSKNVDRLFAITGIASQFTIA